MADLILDKLIKQLPGLMENVSLASHNTFKIGGPAKYFYIAKTEQELLRAVKTAEKLKINYFILGGGSNILVSDQGFDGLVIKARNEDFQVEGEDIVHCGAGLTMGRLLGLTQVLGLGGLEFMAGVPGTVGGAIRGNAGAFGKGFGDVVLEAEVYRRGQIIKMIHNDLKFKYRESAIKYDGGVILSVKIKLAPKNSKEIQEEFIKIIKNRTEKLPLDKPSAGSFFKNIEMDKYTLDIPKIIKELDVTEEEFKEASKHKLPVAFILDRLDLKGKKIGGAQISPKHANFIVNTGHAKAEDVLMLVSDIKMRVRNQLLIQIIEEVQYVGF